MGSRSGVAALKGEDAAGGMDVVGFRWQGAARGQARAGAAMRAAFAAADPLRNWRAKK